MNTSGFNFDDELEEESVFDVEMTEVEEALAFELFAEMLGQSQFADKLSALHQARVMTEESKQNLMLKNAIHQVLH